MWLLFLPITMAYIPHGGTPTSLPTCRTIWSLLSMNSSAGPFVAGICSGAKVVGASVINSNKVIHSWWQKKS